MSGSCCHCSGVAIVEIVIYHPDGQTRRGSCVSHSVKSFLLVLNIYTRARARFFTGDSDLLTDVKAFDECMKMYSEGHTQAAIRKFCENVCVHLSGF